MQLNIFDFFYNLEHFVTNYLTDGLYSLEMEGDESFLPILDRVLKVQLSFICGVHYFDFYKAMKPHMVFV